MRSRAQLFKSRMGVWFRTEYDPETGILGVDWQDRYRRSGGWWQRIGPDGGVISQVPADRPAFRQAWTRAREYNVDAELAAVADRLDDPEVCIDRWASMMGDTLIAGWGESVDVCLDWFEGWAEGLWIIEGASYAVSTGWGVFEGLDGAVLRPEGSGDAISCAIHPGGQVDAEVVEWSRSECALDWMMSARLIPS